MLKYLTKSKSNTFKPKLLKAVKKKTTKAKTAVEKHFI